MRAGDKGCLWCFLLSLLWLLPQPTVAEPLPFKPVDLANSFWYTPIDDELYFFAYQRDALDQVEELGIWRSDGTEEGTLRISADIPSYNLSVRIHNQKLGSRIFYVADTDSDGDNELWFTDEELQENHRIGKFNERTGWTVWFQRTYQGQLIFTVKDNTYGEELWVGSGDVGQYTLLKDICSGSCWAEVTDMIEYKGLLFFSANDGVHESELWVSDGTTAGTQLFANIYAGPKAKGDYVTGSGPHHFHVVGDKLLFVANDGIHGRELWVTEGTVESTRLLQDCTPGDDDGDPYDSNPTEFYQYNDKLYFKTTNDTGAVMVWDIWETDGTTAGTRRLYTYQAAESAFGAPAEFVVMNNRLFFRMYQPEYGYEVFGIDLADPEQGPQLLKDIFPGTEGSDPSFLTVVRGATAGKSDRLYFAAKDPRWGNELWVSDGTAVGTVLLRDFNLGTGGSDLDEFYALGHKLFFRENGWHLWVVDLSREEGGVPDGSDRIKPRLTINAPRPNRVVANRFAIRGIIEDNVGIAAIECRYPGAKDWVAATPLKLRISAKGGQRLSWRCAVRIKAALQKRIARRGGRMLIRVRGSDYAGNQRQLRRVIYLGER